MMKSVTSNSLEAGATLPVVAQQFSKWLNSGFYLALCLILLNYLLNGLSALAAWKLGFEPTFSLDGLGSLANTVGWCGSFIAYVFAVPPITALLICFASITAFFNTRPLATHLRTFFFWLAAVAFAFYYSHVLAGLLHQATGVNKFFMGFVATYTWAKWEQEAITIVLCIQALFSLVIPVLIGSMAIRLSPSQSWLINAKGRLLALVDTIMIPFSLGLFLLAISTFPMNIHYLILQTLSVVLLILITGLGSEFLVHPHLTIVKGGFVGAPIYCVIALCVLLVIASRTILSIPVKPFINF